MGFVGKNAIRDAVIVNWCIIVVLSASELIGWLIKSFANERN